MLSEKTLRRRAIRLGYSVSKGYQRYLRKPNPICRDYNGEPITGYNVTDLRLNCLVWPCFDEARDHLFTLTDVVDFLREEDSEQLFTW